MDKKNIPYIGAHVSTSGGLWNAIKNGEMLGCTAVQFFGSSPRMWHTGKISDTEIRKFKQEREKSNIKEVYLHASYLVNLASASEEIYEKSIQNLSDHLRIAEAIGAQGLIFHVGSGKGISQEEALKKEIIGMQRVLKNVPGQTFLIMENSAGGGAKVGSSIDDIAFLHKKLRSERVKVCFDTAHAFEAGLVGAYTEEAVIGLMNELDKKLGLEHIVVLHINDSKTRFGSHHDRHENIGSGYIGMNGFRALAKEKRLYNKSWILEVPGFEGTGPDKKNVDIVKSLFEK